MESVKLSAPNAADTDPKGFPVEAGAADQRAVTPLSSASSFPGNHPGFHPVRLGWRSPGQTHGYP